MRQIELPLYKPCPKCKSNKIRLHILLPEFWCECADCGFKLKIPTDTIKEAVKNVWNMEVENNA